ncbi:MAG: deoxyribodipyrimidine photo-lyase [bacterium]
MIHEERVRHLNPQRVRKGQYVLYWMQASQRAEQNHALAFAIGQANDLRLPLLVFFGITPRFPDANERHYSFMLEGLREVQASLRERGIMMVIRHISPEQGAVELAKGASLVVCDRGYLKIQREWRRYVADRVTCPFIQVESNVVVPVEVASPKEEYAASTIRPKITKYLGSFLLPVEEQDPKRGSLDLQVESIHLTDIDAVLAGLDVDHSVARVHTFHGGTREAQRRLDEFIATKLDRFHDLRNDPTVDYLSQMSPYLHFGQISPLYIALKVREAKGPGREAYLEELIIRRELAINYVRYNDRYPSFKGLPEWAQMTLLRHANDPREYTYTLDELEAARTHDPYWNAAQREMTITGKMHGYMRMYWGKKILEWCGSPDEAFDRAVYLNNKYELDGRDPSGYAGVAWCLGKHDRPWQERKIFGSVRYMNAKGLMRKFDADAYARRDFSISPG